MITKKQGIAINIAFQSILTIFSIIDNPTKINIGDIASIGTHLTKCVKNKKLLLLILLLCFVDF